MQAPNEAFTLSNVFQWIIGAGVAALFGFVSSWALKHTERLKARHDEADAAEIRAEVEDRHNFRLAQQSLIDTLRNRVKESEEDRANLWKLFREMQSAMANTQDELKLARGRADDCELLHKSDALRISSLETENLALHERIAALEKTIAK